MKIHCKHNRWACWLLCCVVIFAARLGGMAAEPDTATDQLTLYLANDGFVTGQLINSDELNILRWKSPRFVEPFDFHLSNVSIIHFPRAAEPPKPKGEFCLELLGNDVLFGSFVGLTPEHVDFDAVPFGRLRVKRANVARLYRWHDSADLIYLGPNGLSGWREPDNKKLWREESGHITTDQDMASIFGDFGIPSKASIEFEVSWKTRPDFVLALGTSEDPRSLQRAFRFEVWEDELIVLREGSQEADLASLQELAPGAGRIQLQAYINQESGQIAIYSPTGKKLAELSIPDEQPQLLSGIWLANKQGDVRLERLRIVRWNGEPPVEVQADKARVHRRDGTVVYGQVKELDTSSNQLVITEDGKQVRIAAEEFDEIYLPFTGEFEAPSLRVSYQDGTRLSGELSKVEDGALWLTTPAISQPFRAPMADLYSIMVLRQDSPPEDAAAGPVGTLEMIDLRIKGRLANGEEQSERSCLVWQPLGSKNASPLKPGLSGRIVYREVQPAPVTQQQAMQPQVVQRRGGIVGQFLQVFSDTGTAPRISHKGGQRALHLRTGDTIPCEVEKIDEQGVTFSTTVTSATFVPHERIKALELVNEESVARIDRAKRDRLLTLPRMQRDNPPTHLIRSRSGDYLRGRLISMDEEKVQVEVRLETKELPRDRVSRIIWLHDDELAPKDKDEAEPKTRVQAVRRDGIRLTFFPNSFADATLSGESDVLGPCQVQLDDIDQILIGYAIEENASSLAFQQWRLQNAIDPRAFTESGEPSDSGVQPGTESSLVGQPAADFELPMLDGSRFHLQDRRGKIVVVDFWTTWCGPCIQSMPEVERIVGEFKDQGVELVAVNLQESEARIVSMLERQKLNVPVAMDQDGVVAEKYRVTAIPQTVIIDGNGTVVRCFIGGGSKFAENFRAALQATITGGEATQ